MDQDKRLSVDEMMLTIEDSFDIYPNEEDILQLYADLNLDRNHDGFITPEELNSVNHDKITHYLAEFARKHPEKRSRQSEQTWIFPDQSTDSVFIAIQNRIQQLLALPSILITKSDFQVVHYGVGGHYNAHHDSSPISDKPCCTRTRTKGCRICRFATILFYLNDVEEGGETAFPVAGNATLDSKLFVTTHQMNLMRFCLDANIKVKPSLGKAVLWYNHFVDPESGWLGQLDEYTWHGSCAVTKGEKWISNFWIKVTDNRKESLSPYNN